MAYFTPYLDDNGIHMPTYEDRLGNLIEAYRSIFGVESELDSAMPDYQLLSVFAKALDDTSALMLQAYNSRNPDYASGNALDLLLPAYGITRKAGETDASVRARVRRSLAARSSGTVDAIQAAVKNAEGVRDAIVYVNNTGSTNDKGIPAHSIAVVVEGGNKTAVAQAIFDKKPPGIGTFGSTTANAVDAQGNEHPISFTYVTDKLVVIYLFIRVLEGGNQDDIRNAIKQAVPDYINSRGLASSLNVPQLYGVVYNAKPEIAKTFIVTDIQVAVTGTSSAVRDYVPCEWNEKLIAMRNGSVVFYFS